VAKESKTMPEGYLSALLRLDQLDEKGDRLKPDCALVSR
jgi:hypothetical protein